MQGPHCLSHLLLLSGVCVGGMLESELGLEPGLRHRPSATRGGHSNQHLDCCATHLPLVLAFLLGLLTSLLLCSALSAARCDATSPPARPQWKDRQHRVMFLGVPAWMGQGPELPCLIGSLLCLPVISLKASEDSSLEPKKETWAVFEGKPCMFLAGESQLAFISPQGGQGRWLEGPELVGFAVASHSSLGLPSST